MHDYLRAVGFSEMNSIEDEQKMINMVLSDPQDKSYYEINSDRLFVEMRREFGPNYGVAVRGEYDAANQFHMGYYYPYFKSECVTQEEYLEIEKHADNMAYAAVCDDIHVGVALIFYLQNVARYLNEVRDRALAKGPKAVVLSALSMEGTVLIPLNRQVKEETPKSSDSKGNASNRESLIAAAREGNEEAIESLTLEDIDLYSSISRRIGKEDILSIVDSCIMPYGIDSDKYYILGDIMEVEQTTNSLTGDFIYLLKVNCNDLIFGIAINEKDLLGEPSVGRRFRGYIWLQGNVMFL